MTTFRALSLLWSFQKGEDLKPGELAAAVGVDVSTIYRWKRRGQAPVGLSVERLLEFLEAKDLIARTVDGDGRRPVPALFQATPVA